MVFLAERPLLKLRLVFISLLVMYVLLVVPLSRQMQDRPDQVKLGYLPKAEVLKLVVGEHASLLAQHAVVKVLFYFGTIIQSEKNRLEHKPEYFNMFQTLQNAVKLDPYNQDAYYFTQATFTWELQRIKEVNNLLDFGMRYRTWDPQLPFYAGFNAAFFLKDYDRAAAYMKKAAELSHDPLYTNLTARYFYEAGDTEMGIRFLSAMEAGAQDERVKKLYQVRKDALITTSELTKAAEKFKLLHGRQPTAVRELVDSGIIGAMPRDPYGGTFYFDGNGAVRSTSKFAFGSVSK